MSIESEIEEFVQAIVEERLSNETDIEEQIQNAVNDLDLTDAVRDAITGLGVEDMNLEEGIQEIVDNAIQNIDADDIDGLDDKIDNALENFDFDNVIRNSDLVTRDDFRDLLGAEGDVIEDMVKEAMEIHADSEGEIQALRDRLAMLEAEVAKVAPILALFTALKGVMASE